MTQVVNRIVAAVLALALAAAAVIAVIEIALAALGQPPLLVSSHDLGGWLEAHGWQYRTVQSILVGLIFLGLILLFLAFYRGKLGSVPLATDGEATSVTATRRSVERLLVNTAEGEDGVDAATARVGRSTTQLQASTYLLDPGDLQARVEAAAQAKLDELQIAKPRRVRVDLARRDGS